MQYPETDEAVRAEFELKALKKLRDDVEHEIRTGAEQALSEALSRLKAKSDLIEGDEKLYDKFNDKMNDWIGEMGFWFRDAADDLFCEAIKRRKEVIDEAEVAEVRAHERSECTYYAERR